MTVWAAELDDDGGVVGERDDTPEGFGRIAAMTARNVILQRLRDAEDERTYGEYLGKEGDIVARHDPAGPATHATSSSTSARSRRSCRPRSRCRERSTSTGSGSAATSWRYARVFAARPVTLSRTHPNLVRKLFALEVPEVADGTVEIVAIAREAGHRSKVAVRSTRPNVNAKGSCIGPMGARARAVMNELHGEKIDIVDWSEDPAEFVKEALQPARVSSVEVVDLTARSARVTVPDYQLSLAIGREGQNARLAARLTGWRIDIRSDEGGSPSEDTPPLALPEVVETPSAPASSASDR